MRVLVCGGRDFGDRQRVFQVLDSIKTGMSLVIHGAARGADSLAGEWAASRGVPVQSFAADWANLGRSAGPIRNALMLSEGQPNLVVAFPGGKGTDDMVAKAIKFGCAVLRPGPTA